jgi:hypothetical protein
MNLISEYEKQTQIDYLTWQWFPRASGFWFWYVVTLFLWKSQKMSLDVAASVGLGIGVFAWLFMKLLLAIVGPKIVKTYLWQYGCGCFARTLVTEVFQYLGIASICILAFRSGELTLISSVIAFAIGLLNWFLISLKNI